jgi:hypothetical protein
VAQQGGAEVVGNTGMDHATYRLSQQGWNVMPTAGNARGVFLIASASKGLAAPSFKLAKPRFF